MSRPDHHRRGGGGGAAALAARARAGVPRRGTGRHPRGRPVVRWRRVHSERHRGRADSGAPPAARRRHRAVPPAASRRARRRRGARAAPARLRRPRRRPRLSPGDGASGALPRRPGEHDRSGARHRGPVAAHACAARGAPRHRPRARGARLRPARGRRMHHATAWPHRDPRRGPPRGHRRGRPRRVLEGGLDGPLRASPKPVEGGLDGPPPSLPQARRRGPRRPPPSLPQDRRRGPRRPPPSLPQVAPAKPALGAAAHWRPRRLLK